MFPGLRIIPGIEAGEPHYFPASVASVLSAGRFQRVLGSLHAISLQGNVNGSMPRCSPGWIRTT